MSSTSDVYFDAVIQVLESVRTAERATLAQARDLLADVIEAGKTIYTFGTGHSSLLAAEGLYRAGGLAPVSAILEPSVTFAPGAVASTRFERLSGVAQTILDRYPLGEGDALVVFSNSGVNAVPLEVAQLGQERGARVIAVMSRLYASDAAHRKGVGQTLADLADIVIDNHLPPGDALVPTEHGAACASGSTVVGAAIWNALVAGIVGVIEARGKRPPVYQSANLEGADENNADLVRRHRAHVRNL